MAIYGDTGNTATLAFGTTSFVANITKIGGTTQTREWLEDTILTTTSRKQYVPADLIEPGEFEIEYFFNQSASVFAPIGGAAETITITFPLKSGEMTAATLAGTGGLMEATGPELVNDALMRATAKIKWDGKTGPTYTAGSA